MRYDKTQGYLPLTNNEHTEKARLDRLFGAHSMAATPSIETGP